MTNLDLLSRFRRVAQTQPSRRALLEAIVAEAEARGIPCYLVGGAVRDLLREDPSARRSDQRSDPHAESAVGTAIDIDIALDGDALALAAVVAARLGATHHAHQNFGTATLELGGSRIDLSRTRREHYERPGALPQVEPAAIDEDLARRDFTVNAMALVLAVPPSNAARLQPGTLLDPFAGVADLDRALIRTLHDASFQDDPTRLIRACRYAARLDGRFAATTARAARRDLEFVRRLSDGRFGDAWRLLLRDPAASVALGQARRLKLGQAWLPGWRVTPILAAQHDPAVARNWGVDVAEFYWALTGLTASSAAPLDAIPQRCTLTRGERQALGAGCSLRAAKPRIARRATPLSRVSAVLRREPLAATAAACMIWRGVAGHRSEAFFDAWRYVESPLSVHRLTELGVASGPDIGAWLSALRDAVLDGHLPTEGSAEAERWIQSRNGAPPPARAALARH